MTFNEYQDRANSTAQYPILGDNIIYPAMGIAGEAGELLDKIKKHWRNSHNIGATANEGMSPSSITQQERADIIKEMGDVLWYIAALARELNVELDDVAVLNLSKLADRKKRDVVCSQGDNR